MKIGGPHQELRIGTNSFEINLPLLLVQITDNAPSSAVNCKQLNPLCIYLPVSRISALRQPGKIGFKKNLTMELSSMVSKLMTVT